MVVAGPVPPGTLFRADCGARAVTSPMHRLGNAWSSDPPMEIRQFLSKCIARRCFLTCLRDRFNRDRNSPRSAGTAPELLILRSYQMAFIANARWPARDAASSVRDPASLLWGLTHGVFGFRTAPALHPGSCKGTWKLCGLRTMVRRIPDPLGTLDRLRDPDPEGDS